METIFVVFSALLLVGIYSKESSLPAAIAYVATLAAALCLRFFA